MTIDHPKAEYYEGCIGIWTIPCDIAFHVQRKMKLMKKAAKILLENGVKAVAEGANMPSTLEAIMYSMNSEVLFGPAKAANAGGVAVSAMEMSQNSMRLSWTFEEVDEKLKLS